jgi:HEAT repeat protein
MNNGNRQSIHWKHLSILCCGLCSLLFMVTAGCSNANRSGAQSALPEDPLIRRSLQTLVNGLQDSDPRVQTTSIEVIASTHQIRLMPRIRPLLHDPSVPVRFAALIAVGDVQYALAKKDVLRIFKETRENENIRIAAAYALSKLGQKKYSEYYFGAINSQNPTVRANAALLMGKSNDKKALKLLHWALSDMYSDDVVQTQAVESIAMLGDNEIYQKIWSRLISAFADDRIAATKALGALGTRLCQDALLTMLNDSVVEVRLAAAEQLGKMGDLSGESMLVEVLNGKIEGNAPELVRLRIMATMAIAEMKTETLVRYLPRLQGDPSPFVRIAASKAILSE